MSKIIPADDALLAMSDTDLLQLMEDAGLDTAAIADRAGAIAALQAKRDAAEPVTADDAAMVDEPVQEDAIVIDEDAVEQSDEPIPQEPSINTVASDVPLPDDAQLDDEPQAEYRERPSISGILAAAVLQAQVDGDAVRHAALHNFEIAFGDFKRAAAQVERHVEVPTPLYGFVKAVQEA